MTKRKFSTHKVTQKNRKSQPTTNIHEELERLNTTLSKKLKTIEIHQEYDIQQNVENDNQFLTKPYITRVCRVLVNSHDVQGNVLSLVFPSEVLQLHVESSVEILLEILTTRGMSINKKDLPTISTNTSAGTPSVYMTITWSVLDALRNTGLSLLFEPGLRDRYPGIRGILPTKSITIASLLLRMYATVPLGSLDPTQREGVWCDELNLCRSTQSHSILERAAEERSLVRVLCSENYDSVRLYNFTAIIASWCRSLCCVEKAPCIRMEPPTSKYFRHYSRLHTLLDLLNTHCLSRRSSDGTATPKCEFIADYCRPVYDFLNFRRARFITMRAFKLLTTNLANLLNGWKHPHKDTSINQQRSLFKSRYHKLFLVYNICPSVLTEEVEEQLRISPNAPTRTSIQYFVRIVDRARRAAISRGEADEQERTRPFEPYTSAQFIYDCYEYACDRRLCTEEFAIELIRGIEQPKYISPEVFHSEFPKKASFAGSSYYSSYVVNGSQYADAIKQQVLSPKSRCVSRLRYRDGYRQAIGPLYKFISELDLRIMKRPKVTKVRFLDARNFGVLSSSAKDKGKQEMSESSSSSTPSPSPSPSTSSKISSPEHKVNTTSSTDKFGRYDAVSVAEDAELDFPVRLKIKGDKTVDLINYEECFFLITH